MNSNKSSVSAILFLLLFGAFAVFVIIVYSKIISPRKTPTLQTTKTDVAIRGSIFSADGFEIAHSAKLYKASINTRSIDPNKKELFINLFSIYSGIDQKEVKKKLDNKGNIVLSYNLSSAIASNLKRLNSILLRYEVFIEYENAKGVIMPKQGLMIEVSGNNRIYARKDILEPVIGYVRKDDGGKITRISGLKGVEKFYDDILTPARDGQITGRRDVGFNVIMDNHAIKKMRQDGFDITLSIPLRVQKKLEEILDKARAKNGAKEVIAGVMDSESGHFLALGTSKRFNPNDLRNIKDYSVLNLSAIEHIYEPGSTIKPIIYAILLEKNMIKRDESVNLENGVYKIRNYTIRDSNITQNAKPAEILMKSSNIGMVKLAQTLSPDELNIALRAFGFSEKTGIDLPYEKKGSVPSAKKLKIEEATKATLSYGYGMQTTFMQLMRAYASFSNGGFLPTPRISKYISAPNDRRYSAPQGKRIQILSEETASEMHELLIDVVKSGTGKPALVNGISVGGKTGTAKIAHAGGYLEQYNGSFFGFAQDEKSAYTIGVVVFDSRVENDYYGSRTAAPIFKEIVEMLIAEGYLNIKS